MISTVLLIATRGPLAGRKFVFDAPADCTIGRAKDCTIVLPQETEHQDVSRHHCLLQIAPPDVRVRDLGSLNGTRINGRNIGRRGDSDATVRDANGRSSAVPAADGDEIQLGAHTAFRLCVSVSTEGASTRTRRRSSGELRFPQPVPG